MADFDLWMDDLEEGQKEYLRQGIAENLDLYAIAEKQIVQRLLSEILGSKAVTRALVEVLARQENVVDVERLAKAWDYTTQDIFQRMVRQKLNLPEGPDYLLVPPLG